MSVRAGGFVPSITSGGVSYTADVHEVYCCVVGRTQKNSVMSENWAQDTTPQKFGGNREMNQVKVLAPEWHGGLLFTVLVRTAHAMRLTVRRFFFLIRPIRLGTTSFRLAACMRPSWLITR